MKLMNNRYRTDKKRYFFTQRVNYTVEFAPGEVAMAMMFRGSLPMPAFLSWP